MCTPFGKCCDLSIWRFVTEFLFAGLLCVFVWGVNIVFDFRLHISITNWSTQPEATAQLPKRRKRLPHGKRRQCKERGRGKAWRSAQTIATAVLQQCQVRQLLSSNGKFEEAPQKAHLDWYVIAESAQKWALQGSLAARATCRAQLRHLSSDSEMYRERMVLQRTLVYQKDLLP